MQNMQRVRAARAHHAAFRGFSFCRSVTSDAEIRVMAAEEGLVEDAFEVPSWFLRSFTLIKAKSFKKSLAPTNL